MMILVGTTAYIDCLFLESETLSGGVGGLTRTFTFTLTLTLLDADLKIYCGRETKRVHANFLGL
jgi:hypothetical protein